MFIKVLGWIFLVIIVVGVLAIGGLLLYGLIGGVPEISATSLLQGIRGTIPHYKTLNEAAGLTKPDMDLYPAGADFNERYWLIPTAGVVGPQGGVQVQHDFGLFRYDDNGIVNLGYFPAALGGNHTVNVVHGSGDDWLVYDDGSQIAFIFDAQKKTIKYNFNGEQKPRLLDSGLGLIDAARLQGGWIGLMATGVETKYQKKIVFMRDDGTYELREAIDGSLVSIVTDGVQVYFSHTLPKYKGNLWSGGEDLWSYNNGELNKNTFTKNRYESGKIGFDGKNIFYIIDSYLKSELYKMVDGFPVKIGKLPDLTSMYSVCNPQDHLCVFDGQYDHYVFDGDTLKLTPMVRYLNTTVFKNQNNKEYILFPSRSYFLTRAQFYSDRDVAGSSDPSGDMTGYLFNGQWVQSFDILRGGQSPHLICAPNRTSCIYWDTHAGQDFPRAFLFF